MTDAPDHIGYYFGSDCVLISEALHRLGHDLEISIWLDRLMQWLSEQKPEDPQTRFRLQQSVLNDVLEMLKILAIRHSVSAREYASAQLDNIRAIGDEVLLSKARQWLQTE